MTSTEIQAALAAPFDSDEVKVKPGVVSKDSDRAMPLHYIDARCVMDRLDAVLGVAGWQDEYQFLPSGSVVCTLRVRIDDREVVKTDVGSQSEQEDEGDRVKAAVSDSLKRAAVKLGVGRYLYRLGKQWLPYDRAKRQFTSKPLLPSWALPIAAAPPTSTNGHTNGKTPPSDRATLDQLATLKTLREKLSLTDQDVTKRCEAMGFKPAFITGEQADKLITALSARKARRAS